MQSNWVRGLLLGATASWVVLFIASDGSILAVLGMLGAVVTLCLLTVAGELEWRHVMVLGLVYLALIGLFGGPVAYDNTIIWPALVVTVIALFFFVIDTFGGRRTVATR